MSRMSYAIDKIQDMYLPPESANLAQKRLALDINNRYRRAAYWIAYERLGIGSLSKYPLNRPDVKRERPYANLLMGYLDLCKGCHEFARNLYPQEPATHWLDVMLEFKERFIEYSIESREEPELGLYEWVKLQRQIYKQLENRKNPFSDSHPLYFNLIATSCHLAEKIKKFDVDHWIPFLKAFRENYHHAEKKGVGILYVSGDRLIQTARGKPQHLKQLTSKDIKSVELTRYYCL